jgi:DNA-directed RNA polymerase sigma subunit (sigma70/sigma32)
VTASLDEPVGQGAIPLADLIDDPDGDTAWQRTECEETRRSVCSMLGLLPARHRDVLLRRYGLDRDNPQSHEEIAAWLGVGEQRSRQLEQQGLHRLRALVTPSMS